MRAGVRDERRGGGVGRRRRKRGARGGANWRLGVRARAERTTNIPYMFVTLGVSKLSGWLNAFAFCAESEGGHGMRTEVWAGR